MKTVLPREQAVEDIFSKILASPEASRRLREVFYQYLDDEHMLVDEDPDHFLQVLFHAYQNGDVSALLLELCGKSMFDLLREAYLIPRKFHGKAGENPVLLTNVEGKLLKDVGKMVSAHDYGKFRKPLTGMNAYQDPDFIWQMDMTLYALTRMDWKLKRKKKSASVGF